MVRSIAEFGIFIEKFVAKAGAPIFVKLIAKTAAGYVVVEFFFKTSSEFARDIHRAITFERNIPDDLSDD